MTSTPSIPGFAGPVVPAPNNDLVHIRIEVDRSRCATNDPVLNARLVGLEQNGLTLSIAQLVASANLHFAGSVEDEGLGRSGLVADKRPTCRSATPDSREAPIWEPTEPACDHRAGKSASRNLVLAGHPRG